MVKIIFLHPDVGIGGAERLVLDAALVYKRKGHDVSFYTNHYNPAHCFSEFKNGTFPMTVVGEWIPRSIFGRFNAMCVYLRMIYAAIYLALYVIPVDYPKLIFCDLISLSIPFLKMARGSHKVVYYCHYPDKLLTCKGGLIKKLYRAPLNWMEEIAITYADKVLVNSRYTARVYKKAFRKIKNIPDICYPSINTEFFEKATIIALKEIVRIDPENFIVLSINRYDKNKRIELALKTIDKLKHILNEADWNTVHLIIAGGYDPNDLQNKAYYAELKKLAAEFHLEEKVTFLKSPKDLEKISLLYHCNVLLYTPTNEHFGIVPLEAKYFSKPVIAVNCGGPTETIVNDVTGFLCKPNGYHFARAAAKLVTNRHLAKRLGDAGNKRLEMNFSFKSFAHQINRILIHDCTTRNID